MFRITAKVKGFETTEGSYKNQLIAKRHKRRLEKKYPGTTFKIEPVAKKNKDNFKTYYAIKGHIERGKL